MNRFFIFIALIVFGYTTYSQSGIIRGTVIEDATGEPLIGVTVMAVGTSSGSVTDFDGKFEIKLPAGVYDLQVSFVSFETLKITGVQVESSKPTIINDLRLKESVEELQTVVVTADVIRNSEAAILTVKKKSVVLLDGISAASFKKIGDSDASDAVKRITGVSVEGGKYVYVRGLGDRYTKTTLNGVDIPGLDPDRNSLQMDIFPTNLIDNMMVMKSSMAEMPADFTGGVVNIETKDFPDEKIFDVSFGLGYNPSMHFNKDYIAGTKGSTDYLGYDDGTRSLPEEARNVVIPSPVSGNTPQEVNQFVKKFNPVLEARNQTSFMDYSFGISSANQYNIGKTHKIGYILSASYKNSTAFYDDVVFGEYQRYIDPSRLELRYATVQNGIKSEQNILAGLLAGIAYKTTHSKFKFTALHLQNGVNTAGQFSIDNDGEAVGQSGYKAVSNNLEYNQRGLTNLLFNGEHHLFDNKWVIDWKVSPTFSNIVDPDIRRTAFTVSNTDTTFSAGAGGNPNRIWRELKEENLVSKIDIARNLELFGREARIKFGASQIYKERDYEILTYDLQFFGSQPDFGIDPNNVLTDDNIFPNGSLYYNSLNNTPNPNQYNSTITNSGFYASAELNPMVDLKAVIGLRAENYLQRHTGRDVEFASLGEGNNLDNAIVLDALDFFPSLNLVYSVTDQQNVRVSYSQTIARPSFKELSFAQIIDPLTNRIFNGGLFKYNDWDGKLSETNINNYDLRWEMYLPKGEFFSLSAFYKTFDDPIELVRIQEQQTSTEYQPRNVGDGTVLGVEVEFKKTLGFISPILNDFNFSGNLTFVESRIQMTDREFDSRIQYQKTEETINRTRQMAGQSPYIINSGFAYENNKLGLDAGFFYNVKGQTLFIVGGGLFPDIYAVPFHSLNFNMNKSLGKDRRSSLTVNVSNILNDVREEVYRGFNTSDQPFTTFNPGVAFSIGAKHSF